MKNKTLQRKHARDEHRRRANERAAKARASKQASPVVGRRDNVIAVDFTATRPVIRSKSNVRYGNPRTIEKAA